MLHSSMQAHSTIVAIVIPVAVPAVWAAGLLLYRCWRLRVEERLQERRHRAAITASLLGVAATFGHDGSVTVVPTGLLPTPHAPETSVTGAGVSTTEASGMTTDIEGSPLAELPPQPPP